jgi:mycothiol system anti-sigma-R factor
MSCGRPHETDCREVLEKVYFYLDRAEGLLGREGLDDIDVAKIRQHLDECAPCLRQYGLEQQVKALVARSCGCDRAPDALRVRVLQRIRQVRVEIDHVEYRPD